MATASKIEDELPLSVKRTQFSKIGDETMALLETALPGIKSPHRGYIDDSEEEVFFGPITAKETSTDGYKRIKKCRRTLTLEEAALMRRSSFGPNDSITEEDEEEDEDKENQGGPEIGGELEIVYGKVERTTPVPSPRKIDSGTITIKKSPLKSPQIPVPKARTLTPKKPDNSIKEVKSASKMLSHLQPNNQNYSSDEDDGPSLIDVENDQMFDNSIFTEYNDKDISAMSCHLSQQFIENKIREERRKTGNFVVAPAIGDLVQEKDKRLARSLNASSTNIIPETPCLSLEEIKDQTTSKERRESSASSCSDWFNTTREEMILYEKFGEDYDVIVGKMTHDEKTKLKEEVSKATPKSAEELLGNESFESVNNSATTGTSSFACAGNVKMVLPTVKEEPRINEELVGKILEELEPSSSGQSLFEPPVSHLEYSQTSLGGNIIKQSQKEPSNLFLTPTSNLHQYNRPQAAYKTMPSYLRSTAASRLRASPNKNEVPASPGFGSCGKLFADPMSGNKMAARRAMINNRGLINMKNIVSPVSQYIKSNSTPQIMRSIKPKASKFLEEEMKDTEEDMESQSIMPKPKYFAPLPEARYCSSTVALEQRVEPDISQKELPKSFGTINTVQAVVSLIYAL